MDIARNMIETDYLLEQIAGMKWLSMGIIISLKHCSLFKGISSDQSSTS